MQRGSGLGYRLGPNRTMGGRQLQGGGEADFAEGSERGESDTIPATTDLVDRAAAGVLGALSWCSTLRSTFH